MEKAKDLLRDGGKALVIGLLFSAALGAVLFLAGFLIKGMAALAMFVIAGMLLVKGKNPEKFSKKSGWKEHFRIMGYKSVLGIICIAVLLAASAADYLLLHIGQ